MARQRSQTAGLARLLAAYRQPVYALDDRRRIVYCNAACAEWTGLAAGDLIGRRCDYHSAQRSDGAADPAAGLCPPPEVFLGQATVAEVACCDANGRGRGRMADCLPLQDGTGECIGVLVLVRGEQPAESPPAKVDELSPPQLHRRLRLLMQEMGMRNPPNQIIGQSPAIARVREQVVLAARSQARVLIVGPPGSGREYVARAIHYAGSPASSPLAPLACNLLDSDLLETTISSFVASCASLESERPAALLLLEADQLRSDAQAVLAGTMSIGKLRLRTLATARTPLVDLAENGAYRPDLAFALSTVTIEIPALAERVQDIPLLAQHFLERYNAAGGKQLSGFATGAMEQLLAYSWPENVDELAEFVRQACHTAARPQVQAADLPEKVRVTASAEAHPPRREERIVLDEFLAEIERELLARAVRQTKGNKAKAARLLGVSRPRLLRRLDQFGMGDGS